MAVTNQYDELIGYAYRYLLPPDGAADTNTLMRAEWLSAGAALAGGWLESDREYSAEYVRDLVFSELVKLTASTRGRSYVPNDAISLFSTGFNWLLQFEVPGPGVTIH